jgi:hypothetical protein
MDETQVKQTYEVFSKLQFVALDKYIKGMQLLYIALITNQWWIFTNRRKNKIKMDSYDVHVHPIQFQLYDKESFWTFNIIKNIFKYNTILSEILYLEYSRL